MNWMRNEPDLLALALLDEVISLILSLLHYPP
jgi:hypothetical protein